MAGDDKGSVSAEKFLEIGFELRNFTGWRNESKESQERDFRGLYGTSSVILSKIWMLLISSSDVALRPSGVDTPKHLLLFFRWLKSYEFFLFTL